MKNILKSIKKDWLILAIVVLTFVLSLYFYPSLPDRVPSHWNAKGQIDGYSGKFFGGFGIPLINLGLYFLFIILPYLDPKKANYAKFPSAYKAIRYTVHIFFACLQGVILMVSLGHPVNVGMFAYLGASLLFVMIGNVMGKFKHNYFVGIKTPWTLSNEEVWVKTHRMAGPLWVVGGILSAIFAIIGDGIMIIPFIIIVSVIAIVPIIYSYIIFSKLNKR